MPEDATPDRPVLGLLRRERRIALAIVAGALALAAGVISLVWQPAPPARVVMSTGPLDGAYHAFGLQYQRILARSGVELRLEPSSGAAQNLDRLRRGERQTMLALVQGGLAPEGGAPEVVSLGGVFHEPVWVFHRGSQRLERLSELAGLRLAAGTPGSGTRHLAEEIVAKGLRSSGSPVWVDLGGLAAAKALQAGEVDVVLAVSAPEAPAVQALLRAPGISLFSLRQAEALTRQFPFLTRLELPEAAIDLAAHIPSTPTALVAPTASLLAHADLHPVIVDLMMAAAHEVHGRGSVLWRPGTFPAADSPEYTLSPDAERLYKNGPSVLQRYLPFWAVVWIQRLIFIGLPLLAIGIPLARYLPVLYRFGMARRIYRWYGELAFIERAARAAEGDRALQLRRLEDIERRVQALRVPPAFGSQAYTLRMHLQMVRGLLTAAESGPAGDTAPHPPRATEPARPPG